MPAISTIAASSVLAWFVSNAGTIIFIAAMATFTYVTRPKPKDIGRIGEADKARGLKVNTRSTTEPVHVLYGENKIGGNDVFIEAVGTDNDRLWVVQGLGEGEIEGVQSLYLNDKLYTEYGSLVSYYEHKGTSDQAVDANLAAAIPAWTDTLHYTAYVVWKLEFDQDYFQGMPDRQVIVRGRKLYDFRDTTTAYSTNHVLALYDYMTNTRYGLGIAAAKIDTASWTEVANYIDTKGWAFHFAVTADMSGQDVIDTILMHFRGEMVWWDGKFYLRYADLNDEAIAMTIDDEQIAQDDDGKALVQISQPSTFGTADGMRVRFIDPDKNYTEDSLIVGDALGTIVDLQLYGCRDRETAGILGTYYLEKDQLSRTISGTFRDDCIQLEPHDLVTFTSSALGISAQTMRVADATLRSDGLVDMVLEYEAEALYDDVYNITAEDVYSCSLPDPASEPPGVGNVQVSEEQYHYRLRTFTRMNITFDAPSNYPWYSHCEVWRSFDDVTYEYLYNVNTDFAVDPVEEEVTYYIRLKVVSIWGTKQRDNNDYKISLSVEGYRVIPASLTSLTAVVNANSVNLQAVKVADPDVEIYEFRLGSSWSGGIFLSAGRAPNLSLYGVKPGTHTFWCNTLSNNGLYGATPRSATVSLSEPPIGWTWSVTETCDYDEVGETHNNTEQVDYGGEWYLKGSHTPIGGSVTEVDESSHPPTGEVTGVSIGVGVSADRITESDDTRITEDGNTRVIERQGGTGYTVGDILTLSEGNGGCTVYVDSVVGGVVTGISLVTGGTGYSIGDSAVTGGTGNNDAVVSITSINVLLGGTGYTAGDILTLSEGDGNCTIRVTSVVEGIIDDISLIYGGTGYSIGDSAVTGGTGNDDVVISILAIESLWRGTYTSPIYDLGSVAEYLVYLLADMVVTGEGTDWDSIAPSPTTWADIDANVRTWVELMELPKGPQVKIKLLYGDTSPPTGEVERLEILGTVVSGRYYQIEIEITDPQPAVNALVENFELKFSTA